MTRARVLLASAALLIAASPARAQRFRDPEDGAFDASQHLATATGFLPVPMIITEPAVGYGGGLFAAFFHGSIEQWSRRNNGRLTPPSISLVGGFATENGSWGVMAGHFGVWFHDKVRYLGGVGYVSPNLAVYPSVLGGSTKVDFNLEGLIIIQQLKARVFKNVFVGGRYIYGSNSVRFDRDSIPGIRADTVTIATGGLGVMLELDTRDNNLSPTRGTRAQVTGSWYGPALGGDSTYRMLNAFVQQHWVVSPRVGVSARVDGTVSSPGAPFYGKPFLRMRGLPVLQYQGLRIALTEGEVRYGLDRRWTVLGFAGAGWTDNGRDSTLHRTGNVVIGGAGFRYLIARAMGLQAGLDVAAGPDGGAVYIQIGSAWF